MHWNRRSHRWTLHVSSAVNAFPSKQLIKSNLQWPHWQILSRSIAVLPENNSLKKVQSAFIEQFNFYCHCKMPLACDSHSETVIAYCFFVCSFLLFISWRGETKKLPHAKFKTRQSIHDFTNFVAQFLLGICYFRSTTRPVRSEWNAIKKDGPNGLMGTVVLSFLVHVHIHNEVETLFSQWFATSYQLSHVKIKANSRGKLTQLRSKTKDGGKCQSWHPNATAFSSFFLLPHSGICDNNSNNNPTP